MYREALSVGGESIGIDTFVDAALRMGLLTYRVRNTRNEIQKGEVCRFMICYFNICKKKISSISSFANG